MGDLFHDPTIVVEKMSSVLGNPDSSHPLVQFLLCVDTQVLDVFGVLGLDLRVFDSKAVLRRSLVLALPTPP